MAEKMFSKFKGLFEHDTEDKKVKPKRGIVTDKEELESWLKTPEFPLLPSRGQEAFLRYLRGNYYQEDKDITDIDVKAEGLHQMPGLWIPEQQSHHKH
ncbi:uncharacterized protein [Panulirus ornatus]|uniref:uncharacterized protein isoform X3 n=1 Tax=Panulirus ornatus TaxID=150431 RepID=UPI003A878B5A